MTRREILIALAGFSALALVWTYPVGLYLGTTLPGQGDELLNAWILRWNADRLREGLTGWWDAPIFFPYKRAMAYSEHQLGTALFVAPVQWLTDNPNATYNTAFIGSYALAGFGMYLLARELTGRQDAAVVAAVAFAFAPYRASQTAHLQVLMSGWMPIAIWALTRYFRTRALWAVGVLAAAFALQALSNNYFLYYQVLPLTFVAVDGLRRAGREWRRRLAGLAAAGFLAALPIVPIGLVYREVQAEQGFTRSLREVAGYSADVGSYLATAPGNAVWSWLPAFRKPEGALFPGATVLALAAVALWPRRPSLAADGNATISARPMAWPWRIGVPLAGIGLLLVAIATGYGGPVVLLATLVLLVRSVCPWPRTTAGLYGVIAFVTVVLSLGPEPTSWGRPLMPHGPYLWLYQAVPGLGGMRVVSRLATVVSLALAVVAALGARRVLSGRPLAVRWSLAALIVTGLVADGYGGPVPVVSMIGPDSKEVSQLASWLRTRPPGGVLLLPWARRGVPQHFREHQTYTLDVARPLVNGYRGHMPAMHRALEREASILADPRHIGRVVRVLHEVGVRYVVIDGRDYERPADVDGLLDAVGAAVPVLERASFGTIRVVRFSASAMPIGPAPRRSAPIPAALLRVSASPNDARARLAVDGDRVTRWFTGTRQRGRERFSVSFDRPRDIALVRLQILPRSEGDYPRRLRIESIGDDGRSRVLFDDEIFDLLLLGLAREPQSGPVDVELPANRSARLVLRQTGHSAQHFWSINELILWER